MDILSIVLETLGLTKPFILAGSHNIQAQHADPGLISWTFILMTILALEPLCYFGLLHLSDAIWLPPVPTDASLGDRKNFHRPGHLMH